jgi:GTPase
MAIVSSVPGTTRDRRECIGRIGGTYFRLMDTAGVDCARLESVASTKSSTAAADGDNRDDDTNLMRAMMRQTVQAAVAADLVLLLFDARVGVTNDLLETARWLRRHRNKKAPIRKPGGSDEDTTSISSYSCSNVLVLANKLESTHWDYDGSPILDHLSEATRLGFGPAIPISAIHGEGMTDVAMAIYDMDAARNAARSTVDDDEKLITQLDDERPLQLAVLGRQNVGKSTLVNALLQQERVITGPAPGLTRDAIAIEWSWNDRPVQLVDTAGIRKRSQRDHSSEIEDMAVQDALRALKVADVAVLVLDAAARMLQRQELAIMDAVLKEGRALVVVANKMDLVLEKDYSRKNFTDAVREQLEARYPILRKTPIVAVSSLFGDSVHELMPVLFRARDRWARTITTGQLNRWLAEVVRDTPPPPVGGRPVRIKYIIQKKGRPPTFYLYLNGDTLPDSYMRYLTRNFQDTFEMYGMEVRLVAKKSASSNPFEPTRTRTGSRLGGRQARKERMVKALKVTGSPAQRRSRRARK